jgi:DNA-binding LacI/PurR family transcriptional regulator
MARRSNGKTVGRSRGATISDVAARAKVSITTVSHTLNDKGRIDPATRDRVLAAVAELDYRPNRTARALRLQRTGSIAFVAPSFGAEPSQPELLAVDIYMNQATAAARAAFACDHSLLLMPTVVTPGELAAIGIDGGIVCDPMRCDLTVAMFDELDLPVVTIERQVERADEWHVKADNEADTTRLLEHLEEEGAERVAMLSVDADIAWTEETTNAYRAWCKKRGQEPLEVAVSAYQLESNAYEATSRILDLEDPPDAILASAERFALGVIRAARERNLRIPEDLMVANSIDGWEARAAVPPITAIDIRPSLQGATAAELLIARINGEEDVRTPRLMPSDLRLRASTARRSPRR